MLALPAAPAPAPKRQLLVATAALGAAATMLMGGMLAIWWRFREAAPLVDAKDNKLISGWKPKQVVMPEVPTNVMLITMALGCLIAQYAVYAAKRRDRTNTALGLGILGLLGLAVVNAQAYVWKAIDMGIRDDRVAKYAPMFYAVTGTFMVLLIVTLVFNLVTAFRYLGGRTADREVVSSLALFWYILTFIYTAMWFVVYVTK